MRPHRPMFIVASGHAHPEMVLAVNPAMRRAVVSTADHGSAWADHTDPHSAVFVGDSGGALSCPPNPEMRNGQATKALRAW